MNADLSFRFVQLSDLHLRADRNFMYQEINPFQNFQKILLDLETLQPKPDFIIISGDLADDQEPEVYLDVADFIAHLQIPFYWIGGNHDIPSKMSEIAPQTQVKQEKAFVFQHIKFILLNSVEPNCTESFGELSNEELDFLQKELESSQNIPIIIALHHHPVKVNSAYMDKMMLKDADKFLQLLKNYPNVKAVIFGHIHCETAQNIDGIWFLSCPSAAQQFKIGERFALDDMPMGFRIFDVDRQGNLQTKVRRLVDRITYESKTLQINRQE